MTPTTEAGRALRTDYQAAWDLAYKAGYEAGAAAAIERVWAAVDARRAEGGKPALLREVYDMLARAILDAEPQP